MSSSSIDAEDGSLTRPDPPEAQGSVTWFLSRLQDGDPAVLCEIWRRFFPRMAGLARRNLQAMPGHAVDGDDIAQSAFISFWKALERGTELEFRDREDLWKLLGVMTVRKAWKQTRQARAEKRGGGQTRSEAELQTAGRDFRLDEMLGQFTPPEFDLFCEELLLMLDDDQRAVAMLRLQGDSTADIAARLECSQRSVQRVLEVIREKWHKHTEPSG